MGSARSPIRPCFLVACPPAAFAPPTACRLATARPAPCTPCRSGAPRMMAGFGGGGGGGAKKRSPKKKAGAAATDAASSAATSKVRSDKLYARLVADSGAAEHAVLVRLPGAEWKRVGDLAVVEAALPSGVSGGVRAHKREILEAAKRAWTELGVAAAKGTALVIGTRLGVDVAEGQDAVESGVSEVVKVSLAEVEAVPWGTASAFKPRGRKGDEAYFGKTLKDGRSMPIDTTSQLGLTKSETSS